MKMRTGAAVWAATLFLAGTAWGGGAPFRDPILRDIEPEPAAVELADFSEDGILDLLVIQGTYSGYALVYQGIGDGTFPPAPSDRSALYLDSLAAAVADFNGDGVLDLAALNGACST